jgi:protein EFR3
MHLFFSPNHVQLITACYPPSASLLTSGPEYRPNAQELSRLTYYASNKPGKINKLSYELEKRIKLECRKAQSNNPRSRAYVTSFDLAFILVKSVFQLSPHLIVHLQGSHY